MKIFAFTGRKSNGKTTASQYLMERIRTTADEPVLVERINFKDSLIEELTRNMPQMLSSFSEMYEMSISDLFREKPPLMRKLMQDYGLMRRAEDIDYWVSRLEKKISKSQANYIIIDDVRFLSEQEAINKVGGKLYKIIREGQEVTDHHATEREIDLIECEEIRAKDKEELFNQLDKILL